MEKAFAEIEQREAEEAEQAQREYEESINVQPDGTECSPGTGLGEPDPQCEPLPGSPDYNPNHGY